MNQGTVKLVMRCAVLEQKQKATLWQLGLVISAAAKLGFVMIVVVFSVVKLLIGHMKVTALSDVRLLWMKSLFVGMLHMWTVLFELT